MSEERSPEHSNWFSILWANTKEKFGDVFLSYFITFEILYNWKFLYSLFSSSEDFKERSQEAEKLIKLPQLISEILETVAPSPITLSVFSALFMSLLYPIFSFFIIWFRKTCSYHFGCFLEKDYPNRIDYQKRLLEIEDLKTSAKKTEDDRVNDIYYVAQAFLEDRIKNSKDVTGFRVGYSSEANVFVEDEVVVSGQTKTVFLEKLYNASSDQSRRLIILKVITPHTYLVCPIRDRLHISKRMKDSGKEILLISKDGYPFYHNKDSFELINRSNYLFFANYNPNEDLLIVQKI